MQNVKRQLFLLSVGLALVLAASLMLATIEAWGSSPATFPISDRRNAASLHSPTGVAVGGVITQSTTWTQAQSPYTLIADVVVTNGVTLTVEPGVQVRGSHGTQLQVRGHLEAVGSQPITFTSSANAGPGGWEGLVFSGGTGHLVHVVVRYAGQNNGLSYSSIAVRDVLAGEVRIESCQILSAPTLPTPTMAWTFPTADWSCTTHCWPTLAIAVLTRRCGSKPKISTAPICKATSFCDNDLDRVLITAGSLGRPRQSGATIRVGRLSIGGQHRGAGWCHPDRRADHSCDGQQQRSPGSGRTPGCSRHSIAADPLHFSVRQ